MKRRYHPRKTRSQKRYGRRVRSYSGGRGGIRL